MSEFLEILVDLEGEKGRRDEMRKGFQIQRVDEEMKTHRLSPIRQYALDVLM